MKRRSAQSVITRDGEERAARVARVGAGANATCYGARTSPATERVNREASLRTDKILGTRVSS